MSERTEALFRILVLIVTGVVLWLWGYLAVILAIVHWLIALFTNKRNKDIADFLEYWNTESYRYYRYLTGVNNERPFPFSPIEKMSKFSPK